MPSSLSSLSWRVRCKICWRWCKVARARAREGGLLPAPTAALSVTPVLMISARASPGHVTAFNQQLLSPRSCFLTARGIVALAVRPQRGLPGLQARQIKNGCMRYIMGGNHRAQQRSVRWRWPEERVPRVKHAARGRSQQGLRSRRAGGAGIRVTTVPSGRPQRYMYPRARQQRHRMAACCQVRGIISVQGRRAHPVQEQPTHRCKRWTRDRWPAAVKAEMPHGIIQRTKVVGERMISLFRR